MCGYCSEQIALDILKKDISGALQMKELGANIFRYFYLRESPDLQSALGRLKRSIAQNRVPYSGPRIPDNSLRW